MALKIKQGDAYGVPISAKLNGAPLNMADVDTVELTVGDGKETLYVRKTYPGEVELREIDEKLFLILPITQEEAFTMPSNGAVAFDMRVMLNGGAVIGARKMVYVTVLDALSEEVL